MKKYLTLLVIIISIITVLSGLLQLAVPGFVLAFVGAEITPASRHFFGIVGMFMALFGSMMLHAVYSFRKNDAAVFWAAMQKLGASAAVGLGIAHEIFNTMSVFVAVFDLLSGIIFLWYYADLYKSR